MSSTGLARFSRDPIQESGTCLGNYEAMNLSDLANLGQIVGAIGVMITLVYLAIRKSGMILARAFRKTLRDGSMDCLRVRARRGTSPCRRGDRTGLAAKSCPLQEGKTTGLT